MPAYVRRPVRCTGTDGARRSNRRLYATLLFSEGQIISPGAAAAAAVAAAMCSRCTLAACSGRALPLGSAGYLHGRSSIFAHVSRATTAHQGTSYWIAAPTIFAVAATCSTWTPCCALLLYGDRELLPPRSPPR